MHREQFVRSLLRALRGRWFGVLLLVPVVAVLAAPPELPQLNTIVKATEVAPAVQDLLTQLETDLADPAGFRQSETRVEHSAYILALLMEGVAQTDGEVPWKGQARRAGDLALQLAKTKNYNEAKHLLATLKGVLQGKAPESGSAAPEPKRWEELSPLLHVMKEVNLVNRPLRRYVRREAYFKKYREELHKSAAVMALLAYVAAHDSHAAEEAKKPVELYHKHSLEFVKQTQQTLEAVRAGDFKKALESVKELQNVCTRCHEQFRPDVVIEE
jgi:cellobiose-specific phosphotransferase system component IIA